MVIRRGVRLLAVSAALLLAATSGHQSFIGATVVVNGQRVGTHDGAVLSDVLGRSAECGRVLSAVDHRVLSGRTGLPATVLINGQVASLTAAIYRDDRIRVIAGADILEPVVEETRTLEPPTSAIVGRGQVPKVVSAGTPGYAVLRVGAYSGEVVATDTVVAAAPALVRNVPAPGTALIALTFDDGPWPVQTETILGLLAERGVPATFFMLGSRVERTPEIARAVVNAGHAVGNHTFRHVYLDAVPPDVAAWEIEYTNQTIQVATGVRPGWIRAPGGHLGGDAHALIAQAGMRSALWTVDPQDWRNDATPEDVAGRVISAARPGAIVVLHDGGGDQSATIAALPMIIDTLRAQGYEFVTLDEMPDVRAGW